MTKMLAAGLRAAAPKCPVGRRARTPARLRAEPQPAHGSQRTAHIARSTVVDHDISLGRKDLERQYSNGEEPLSSATATVDLQASADDSVVAASATPEALTPPTTPAEPEKNGLQALGSGSLKGMILLNIGAALFGSNQVIIKTTEELLSPVALDALRFGAAALCFVPVLPRALRQPALLVPALELGLWLTGGYTCQAFGLSMTSASHGAFTGTFTVLAVPLLVGLSGRAVAGRTWAAAAAALLGVSLLTTSGGDPNLGDLICIASALLFGVHKWRSESITTNVDDTVGLVALQLLVLAATSVLLCVPEAADFVANRGLMGSLQAGLDLPWAAILFMGVGTTAATLWIEMDALKEVSAPLAALIYTAEPLWGAGFAWVLLDERWGMQGWAGAAMIVGASLATQLGGDVVEHVHKAEDEPSK